MSMPAQIIPTPAAKRDFRPLFGATWVRPPRLRAARRRRILLVEDHADTALLMSRLLARAGYSIHVAPTARGALGSVNACRFDLMICDIGLPDSNGYELMRRLTLEGKQVPAIAVSGFGDEEAMLESLGAGFRAHLLKPFAIANLLDLVAQAIE